MILEYRAQCNLTITQSGTNLVVKAVGIGPSAAISKTIELQFQQAQMAGQIFNYGIASKGEIVSSSASW